MYGKYKDTNRIIYYAHGGPLGQRGKFCFEKLNVTVGSSGIFALP